MTDKEVMQMALGRLETARCNDPDSDDCYYQEAIEALRTALAQCKPNPFDGRKLSDYDNGYLHGFDDAMENAVLWVGSDEPTPGYVDELNAAIKALRTALAQQEQEPVAWIYDFPNPDNPAEVVRDWTAFSLDEVKRDNGINVRPLYLAPPKLEWQGLTKDEAAACWSTSAVETWMYFEAALKEKNNK